MYIIIYLYKGMVNTNCSNTNTSIVQYYSTHWGLMMFILVSELGHHCFNKLIEVGAKPLPEPMLEYC